MVKKVGLLLSILWMAATLQAQDSIVQRVLLIGDAGEINLHQKEVLTAAAGKILPSKTRVLFLGDNIYPRGMSLPGQSNRTETEQIIEAQYTPMIAKGAPVYFIPGNHDWDRMGKNGLAKIREQAAFINHQNNPLLHFVPSGGCPGPVEIPVNDRLVIIAFDSEWWLFPHNKENDSCNCTTKDEFMEALASLANKNQHKTILLAAHHPFQSYGAHGGYFQLKDHLFPLTNLNKNLYIPLPVIGSLYPFLRTALPNPEDQMHPAYKEMIAEVDSVFARNQNVIHIAGHEHGLQFIQNQQIQIVSGAGAKNAYVKKGKGSRFASPRSGFVMVDQLTDYSLRLTYYYLDNDKIAQAYTDKIPFVAQTKLEAALNNSPLLQQDSVVVKAAPELDKVSKAHRKWFGENYRKEWAADTKLPVLKLSQLHRGLTPTQQGGGLQTKSLRLVDAAGKEWVLRNVVKNMEFLLPEQVRETFAKDVIMDALSAQHPYSALIVPPLANAAGVPHTNPVIGVVAPDKNLGIYSGDFIDRICLLEEREPLGKSDNTPKMYKTLKQDNDNTVDTAVYFKARLLDLLIGDWDRHEDQWRWAYKKDKKDNKRYEPVPRDRDQVLHVVDGVFPAIASSRSLMPRLHDFGGTIKKINEYFTAGSKINANFFNQYDYEQWMQLTNAFIGNITDSVLEDALQRLPESSYRIRHDQLLKQFKERRDHLPGAMATYYRFFNRIVDIQTSDKNEWVQITDTAKGGLLVSIHKISKSGKTDQELFHRVFDPAVTKELRLFIHDGDDSVVIRNTTPIKLRIVGQKDSKDYLVENSKKHIRIYGKNKGVTINGDSGKVWAHLRSDSANTSYLPTNLYNRTQYLPNVAINRDDGLMLGLSVRFINQSFRKTPYGNLQELSFRHAFSTGAYHFGIKSEWLHALGKADMVVNAQLYAPDNTQNFFGLGNNTEYDKNKGIRYYRSRFTLLEVMPQLRWRKDGGASFSIAPLFQMYSLDQDDNAGRLITTPSFVRSYDSSTISNTKYYTGVHLAYTKDARNNRLLPSSGGYFNITIQGFKGLNAYSRNFAQATTEMSVYKKLDPRGVFVISDRLGGGATFGNAPFYQSLFLGGQDNLLGFRQYRFAGEQLLYNNFRVRVKLLDIASYILPGQLGLAGFFDAGKVWAKGYNSNTIHTGVGGGVYFSPAQLFVVQVLAGYSKEGWLPYVSLGFRF
ncbi:metallophosphoesterase [Niabella soli]|uniref:Membrane protein n=1 Tax=Niabella soli DSM 19437 TaxID=929713 RepID=W0F3E8_9BACT|nr:metallophosphoesterase [Niabella soli]AHF16024.1 membrane protein [Niabella soli DSM 19437]